MNKYQKKVLIIVFAILALISVIAIIWSLFIKNGSQSGQIDNPTNPNNTTNLLKKDISLLEDYNEFFTVSNIINDYYDCLISKNVKDILNLLDDDYKKEMGVQSNNVLNILGSNYHTVTYTPMEIYYNKGSIITYYFVNGYMEDVSLDDESSVYSDNINFLVIVNKQTRKYAITPLKNNINIESYAKNYELEEKELNYNYYKTVNTSLESVLITYLNVFRDLLFLDNERAYQMLDENTKKNYESYQDFSLQKDNIYEYIPSNIFGYSVTENGTQKIYKITDENKNEIIIYEDEIMNFHISY